MQKIKASLIAQFLNSSLIGKNITINGVCSINNIKKGKLTFLVSNNYQYNYEVGALIIVCDKIKLPNESENSFIKFHNPKLAYIRVVNNFFIHKLYNASIANTSKIGKNVKIGESVSIGDYCIIGDNVSIGKGTIINNNVIIVGKTIIGNNCFIKSFAVIGEDGFGFEFDEENIPIRIPHIGSVVVGNGVEIGSFCSINKGTIDDTIISDNVKINDHVHIAHNCFIGKNSIITGCVNISGSVQIGENCWLAPNCSIRNKIKIGNNVKVGIGAVVTKSFTNNKILVGNPADTISNFKILRKIQKKLIDEIN